MTRHGLVAFIHIRPNQAWFGMEIADFLDEQDREISYPIPVELLSPILLKGWQSGRTYKESTDKARLLLPII